MALARVHLADCRSRVKTEMKGKVAAIIPFYLGLEPMHPARDKAPPGAFALP